MPDASLTTKWLIGPTITWGREVLVAKARKSGGHIGWRPMTLRGVAEELAFAVSDRRVAGDIELGLLIGEALNAVAPTLPTAYKALVERRGFRTAIGDAVLELRVAGCTSKQALAATVDGTPARVAATVLQVYEELLGKNGVRDPASLFRDALGAFEDEGRFVLPDEIHLAEQLAPRGLPLELLQRLRERGAVSYSLEPVAGEGKAKFFVASTPLIELKEGLRRAAAAGVPFDQVEFACTDPDTYGVAFEALLRHLDVPGSALHGVPWRRTLIGRTVSGWWDWLSTGLPADRLRGLAESGQFGLLPTERLRELDIGWGRSRYEAAVTRLRAQEFSKAVRPYDDEEPDQFEARQARRAEEEGRLAEFLDRLLEATPKVPEQGGAAGDLIAVADLAGRTQRFLDLLEVEPGGGEAHTVERLRARLVALSEGSGPAPAPFAAALVELESGLADLRAWPGKLFSRKPRNSQGGMPHLTDLAHAGTSGRSLCFVVGLDADRVAGPRLPDPILPDDLRTAIGLPTTGERRAERRRLVAEALKRLGRSATLSFSLSGEDGRSNSPAPALLERFRLDSGRADANFQQLLDALGTPVSSVPSDTPLDGRDVWLGAIGSGPVLLGAVRQVRQAYSDLDRGLVEEATWAAGNFTPAQGEGATPAGALDPRKSGAPISPSTLELLGKCPLAFFYRRGLGLSLPDETEFDPDRWLDAAQRGSLLHAVFEAFGREFIGKQDRLGEAEASTTLDRILQAQIDEWRDKVAPPNELIYLAECRELGQATKAFLLLERGRVAAEPNRTWVDFEVQFPTAGTKVEYPGSGKDDFPVRGVIDRVDKNGEGDLVIVDYKTGSTYAYRKDPKKGPFRGGRSLQPAIYGVAANRLVKGAVAAFEYLFPTAKGRNQVVRYDAAELKAAEEVIGSLLSHPAAGHFPPTSSPDDCKLCDFRDICRVRDNRFEKGAPISPRADWSKDHLDLPALAQMKKRRTAQ